MSDEIIVRSGKFGGPKLDAVARRLIEQLEREPDTDWVCTGEWLVLRMYGESGKTDAYMVAKTVAEVKTR